MTVASRIEALPRWAAGVLVVTSILGITGIDVRTAADVSVDFLYILPVALATWRLGLVAGVGAAVVCAGGFLGAFLAQPTTPSSPTVPYWDASLELATFLTVAFTLARLRHLQGELLRLAQTDVLTGIANRRAFEQRLELELARCRRTGRPLSVAYFDLDRFKLLNDTWGHVAGDQVLRTLARNATGRLRATDFVARVGGDEFAVILPETDAEQASVLLTQLEGALLAGIEHPGPSLGVSLGAVTYTTPPATVDEVLRSADDSMYQAKARRQARR